jgi:hypothetical protein
MPVRSSAPIALRYSVSIRAWVHTKLIRQTVLTVRWTELKSSNAASLVMLPAANQRQAPSSRSLVSLRPACEPAPSSVRRLILGAIARALREQRLCQPQGCFGSAGRASSLRVSHGASTWPERTFRWLDLWSSYSLNFQPGRSFQRKSSSSMRAGCRYWRGFGRAPKLSPNPGCLFACGLSARWRKLRTGHVPDNRRPRRSDRRC